MEAVITILNRVLKDLRSILTNMDIPDILILCMTINR
jgi:hypothetical protein